jgi:hypothetical protein
MTYLRKAGRLAAAAAVLAVAVGGEAAADCAAFPKVDWWGEMSHAKVKGFVDSEYDGDWAPYVEKWERKHIKLKRWVDTGSSLTIKKTGTTLQGETLKAYFENVGKRLRVVRCLAASEGSEGFDTKVDDSSLKPASD